MPLPLIRYPLDPTGIDPNNAVVNEIRVLNAKPIRAVVPTYGPIFTAGLTIYDNADGRLLIRGTDYQCVELLQEATVRYGKEVAALILILNPAVSNEIRYSYQVLGGNYQNDVSGLINLYETIMLDNRAVDWVNVLNKPHQYPPGLHNHLIQDVYGFEFLVVALERIRNAIVLSDVPAFEELVTWVKNRTLDVVSNQEIDNAVPVNKIVTLEKLLYSLDKLNFNGITLTPAKVNITNNTSLSIKLSSTNLPDGTVLYWTIEHIDTDDSDFNLLSGIINITSNAGQFSVPVGSTTVAETEEKFRIAIRRNSISGPVIARTGIIAINADTGGGTVIDFLNACCLYDPRIAINPMSLYFVQES